MTDTTQAAPARNNPLIEALINIIIPVLVLSFLSKEQYLGNKLALIVALAFPILYGLKDLIFARKFNVFSFLGVLTVALTGGMGLMEIDPKYIAIKEAAVPGLIGLMTIISLKTPWPLVKTILFNEQIMQVDRIVTALDEHNTRAEFEKRMVVSTLLLALSFFISSALNYGLAKYVLQSPPGTEAFNSELARMMMLSYPVIVVPSYIVMLGALFYTYRSVRKLTDLTFEQILKQH